jgi:hypothetical protein
MAEAWYETISTSEIAPLQMANPQLKSRGDSICAEWFPQWLLELAEAHNAVIISPNYRFLPEATGVEILEDVDDFWTWLHSDKLTALLGPQSIELDFARVLAAGDSAGGLLSII